MSILNGKRISFNQLIKNDWIITIPMIQRDFAYGREKQKLKAINFINSLIDSLLKKDNPLDLNFVYGSTNKQKEFIIIDGQQRLTVLFLLHWYISGLKNNFDVFKNTLVKNEKTKFDYQTRNSSSEFINAMVSSVFNLNTLINNSNKDELKNNLKEQPWFLKSWKADPSVVSMLSLIDIIHNKCLELNIKDKEIYSNNITFQILDINAYSLTDDLYIKMNARGKPLSNWQNFKAYLYEFIAEEKLDEGINVKKWEEALDKRWLDLFWKYSKNKENVENNMLNYFINILIFQFSDDHNNENNLDVLSSLLKPSDISIVNYCKEKKLLNINYINKCFNGLEALISIKIEDLENKIKDVLPEHFTKYTFREFLFNQNLSKINLYDRSYFNAVLTGLRLFYKNNITLEYEKVERWLRVLRNLVYNQNIDNNKRLFYVLKAIAKIENENSFNIDEYPLDELNSGFTRIQIEDEIAKRKLLKKGINTKDLLYKLEDHFYLYGQINFIIKMAFDEHSNKIDINKIEKYGNKLCSLIDNNHNNDKFLFQRALLTKGYYFGKRSSNHTLCLWNHSNARERNENWRTVFNDDKKRGYLKQLLDEERKLVEIIDSSEVLNWRKYFIKELKLFKYSEQGLIRKFSDKNIRILKTTSIGGRQGELKTLYLYYKKFKNEKIYQFYPFKNINYYTSVGQSSLPCIYLDNWKLEDNSNYALDIYNKFDEGLYFHFFNRNGQVSDLITQELIEFGFEINEENKYFLKVKENDIMVKLFELLNVLKTIKL